MTLAQTFADELKTWRGSLHWTQATAAEWLRVSLRTYEGWEAGRHQPLQEGLLRLRMEQAKAS